jgi:hypothetical protein
MHDAFAHFYPHTEERFTCWEQYRNRRYVNEGSRIDYFLVDEPLLHDILPGPPLPSGSHDPDSAAAALWAVTAGGLWEAAPYDGTGMGDSPAAAYQHQFAAPATSIVYTPPQFSDHVGISLLIAVPASPPLLLDSRACRPCQPHLRQPSVHAFLAAAACKRKASDSSAGESETKAAKGGEAAAELTGTNAETKAAQLKPSAAVDAAVAAESVPERTAESQGAPAEPLVQHTSTPAIPPSKVATKVAPIATARAASVLARPSSGRGKARAPLPGQQTLAAFVRRPSSTPPSQ